MDKIAEVIMKNYILVISGIMLILLLSGYRSRRYRITESQNYLNGIHQKLTDTIPFLNKQEEDYFIGNGIAGAGGNSSCKWNFLIGPDYTSPNFLESEELEVEIKGLVKELTPKMHRISGTGIYFGCSVIGGVKIFIIDYAIHDEPVVVRHLLIENESVREPITLKVRVEVKVKKGIRFAKAFEDNALLLLADTDAELFGNGDGGNWKTRYALLSLNEKSQCSFEESGLSISSEYFIILPDQDKQIPLSHYLFDNSKDSISRYFTANRKRRSPDDFSNAVLYWEDWLGEGKKFSISDQRLGFVIESMLVGIKMQQKRCGGFIAGARKYTYSYVRDSHGACRGLLACNNNWEVKKYLEVTDHKFKVFKYIPDAVQMGADLFTHGDGNQFAESPAYVVLLARDYYAATNDVKFLDTIQEMLKYCIDVQVDFARAHNWLLPFNGDETEQYCIKEDGKEYGGFPALSGFDKNDWSMPSVAACIASLEFYSQYLNLKKMNADIATYNATLRNMKESLYDNFFFKDIGSIHCAKRKDNTFYPYIVTNFELMSLWFGTSLESRAEIVAAENMIRFINPETGFLPNALGETEGFCGNFLGYLLYNLTKSGHPYKDTVFKTLMGSNVISRFGMINEFYGPHGIPNKHNLRCFESGIVLEAIVNYLKRSGDK